MARVRELRIWFAAGVAAIAIGVAGVAGIGASKQADALTNCTVSDFSMDAEEQAFLVLINNYRAQNGRTALSASTNLNRAATWHATDMGAKKYFSHTDSLGRDPSTRARNCDYPQGAGENIAAGTVWSTASAAFNAWRNSSGHNANMLNTGYRQIGIARVYTAGSPYGWYWVTNFGSTNDGTNGGGGGGTTATNTPTRTPTNAGSAATPTRTPTRTPTLAATTGPASIASPANGSTLPGSSATFSWAAATGGLEYFLYAGTSRGSNNIHGSSTGTATSKTITNLPTNGSTVHVRLWTRFSSGWQYRDYSYTSGSSGGGGGSTPTPTASATATPTAAASTSTKAAMTSPAPGSILPGSSATFQWTAASGAREYFFYMGSSVGAYDIANASTRTNRSITLNGLPTDDRTLYVRLWTRTASGWVYNDYTYRAN